MRRSLRVVLGPGAFGSPTALRQHVDGLVARGVAADAVALPRGRAEAAADVFRRLAGPDVVAGGHSFGGRAASLAAAEVPFAGLLLFGFPLAGRAEERTRHFPRIPCPVLLLSGEEDELAPLAELRERAALLPRGRLHTFSGANHQLRGSLDAALDEAALFLAELSRA